MELPFTYCNFFCNRTEFALILTVNVSKVFKGRCWKDEMFNPLEFRGIYCATSNNVNLVHWPLMGGLLHLVQRGGDWAGP